MEHVSINALQTSTVKTPKGSAFLYVLLTYLDMKLIPVALLRRLAMEEEDLSMISCALRTVQFLRRFLNRIIIMGCVLQNVQVVTSESMVKVNALKKVAVQIAPLQMKRLIHV